MEFHSGHAPAAVPAKDCSESVLAGETVTKPGAQRSLAMRASQWELVEQLIPVLQPLAKGTEIKCGMLHVGLFLIQ